MHGILWQPVTMSAWLSSVYHGKDFRYNQKTVMDFLCSVIDIPYYTVIHKTQTSAYG